MNRDRVSAAHGCMVVVGLAALAAGILIGWLWL